MLPETEIDDDLQASEISADVKGNTEGDAVAGSMDEGESTAELVKQRKPRWKAEGKETAKKTKKLQEKKAAKANSRAGKKSKKK